MKKGIFSITALAMVIGLFSVSCSEDDKDTQPELPPIEAFQMDFSEFIEDPAQAGSVKSALISIQNASTAYASVVIWNTMITLPTVLPVAAYVGALQQTPVYLDDNSWQWSFTAGEGVNTFTARLVTTRISNEEFKAEMFISTTSSIEEFMWFGGTVRYDRTHAVWTLYESPENNVAWLEIEWTKDWEAETSSLEYTIVKDGHEEEGSYITFGITDDADFEAYYTISYSRNMTEIKWNRTTKAGMIKNAVVFEDSEWHCWNEFYQDVDCN